MSDGYQALREGAAWLDLSTRGRIVARGRDRARFLHNVTTNDVKKMMPGDSCYAFLLTPQGRIVGDLQILCRADDFLLDTEPELREKVRLHILKYKVADQIELEDVTDSTAAIGVEGPAAPPPLEGWTTAPVHDHRTARLSCVLFTCGEGSRDRASDSRRRKARHKRRRSHRAPRKRQAALRRRHPQTSLPAGDAADSRRQLQKGCYLGQEIVERIRARGHVNRLLKKLELPAPRRAQHAP